MPCSCCEITDQAFGEEHALAEVKEYRGHGPAAQTRLILEALRSLGLKDASLLDIGGGVGAIHHELLEDTARRAIHVDASSAYLQAAREEAARRGHAERVQFIHADFTEVATGLPQAELVTLDRVVCCYPDFRGLLKAAAGRSRDALAITYPRQTWYVRIGLQAINFFSTPAPRFLSRLPSSCRGDGCLVARRRVGASFLKAALRVGDGAVPSHGLNLPSSLG
jgi:magnesium-protoporphyrin O-methyltransferase